MFLGIDTSCYTTSLAVVCDRGRLLYEQRILLEVGQGERGLRQSEGIFQHLRNLPSLAEEAGKILGSTPEAVAAAVRPRPADGSYMPVFMAGTSFGRALAGILHIPFFGLSHQEGHLLAGLWSSGVDWHDFLAVHMSGGTTDLLSVRVAESITVCEVGGSTDLQAGQFIDRVGVSMGLPFPAGPHLEKLAREAGQDRLDVPVAQEGLTISFSGPESHVQRELARGNPAPAAVARGVEHCIAESLFRLVENARRQSLPGHVLFVGGVAANSYIREYLEARLGKKAAFASPRFAGDNALGAALFARRSACSKTSKN